MSVKSPRRLLSIESPLPRAHFMVRLLEQSDSCQENLWKRLCDGTYDKPFILDKGLRRFLHFSLDTVQSAMVLAAPQRLILSYTRKMMAFLLFHPNPQRILLLGLGGGSLAKFCYQRLPAAMLTAVEVDADVIALRREFCIPADDHRFRVIRADGAAYVSTLSSCEDVILADACDRTGIAAEFDSQQFYRDVRNSLAPGGIFITNVCGDDAACDAHLTKLRDAFDHEVLTLQMTAAGNIVAFGFKERRPTISWERLAMEAVELKRRFGIDFPKYVQRFSSK
jgi:spermidine synthase